MSATAVHSLWTMAGGVTSAAPTRSSTAPHIEYAQLAPGPDRHRRGGRRRPRRGVRAAPVPLLRAGRSLTVVALAAAFAAVVGLAAGGLRHDQGAHRRDGRHRRRRPALFLQGTILLTSAWSPSSPSPSAGSTRRRTATASTRSPRRPRPSPAARARRPRSRPGSPPPRSSRCCSSRSAGMLVFPAANDLLTLFVALEVFSLPLYLLCALARRKRLMSQEAAVKYFLLGAFSSAFLLFGIALLYGYAGSVSYAGDRRGRRRHGRQQIDPALADTMGNDALLLIGGAMVADGAALQGRRRPVPHVDPGRLPGRPDPGHRLHGRGHEGRRVRRAAAPAVRGAAGPALGLAAGHVGRRDRHDAGRRDRRHHPDRHQAAAGLLVHRARRLHPRRCHRDHAGRHLLGALLPGARTPS